MEVALIPPYCMLHRLSGRKYQMLLPEALGDRLYGYQYKDLADSSFLILDNGMFEEGMLSTEALLNLAVEYRVDEIVMPDTRGKMHETLLSIGAFLDVYTSLRNVPAFNLMAVVQVAQLQDIPYFIAQAVYLEQQYFGKSGVFTYGVPRRLAEALGPHTRVEVVKYIENITPGSAIHLLGLTRTPHYGLEIVALNERVRSIDTSAPFVWATRNADIFGDTTPHLRPTNYMYMGPNQFPKKLLDSNIEALDAWAHGRP